MKRTAANTARDNEPTLTQIKENCAIAYYTAIGTPKSKMRKLHIKRKSGSVFIEPANRPTEAPSTDCKVSVLEILGEIVCLIVILILGWIALVVF